MVGGLSNTQLLLLPGQFLLELIDLLLIRADLFRISMDSPGNLLQLFLVCGEYFILLLRV